MVIENSSSFHSERRRYAKPIRYDRPPSRPQNNQKPTQVIDSPELCFNGSLVDEDIAEWSDYRSDLPVKAFKNLSLDDIVSPFHILRSPLDFEHWRFKYPIPISITTTELSPDDSAEGKILSKRGHMAKCAKCRRDKKSCICAEDNSNLNHLLAPYCHPINRGQYLPLPSHSSSTGKPFYTTQTELDDLRPDDPSLPYHREHIKKSHLAPYFGNEVFEDLSGVYGQKNGLHVAATNGDGASCRRWAEEGLDLDSPDPKGYTALCLAAQNGHKSIVEYLLAEGADANAPMRGITTPLHLAVEAGNLDIAQLLLGHKDVRITQLTPDSKEKPALPVDFARSSGNKALVDLLQDKHKRLYNAYDAACHVEPAPFYKNINHSALSSRNPSQENY